MPGRLSSTPTPTPPRKGEGKRVGEPGASPDSVRADSALALRRRPVPRAEGALHQRRVAPAAELETDRGEAARMNEAEARVQGDRGRHVVADHRHHLPEAAALAFLDQAREERPADAAA